MVEGGWGNFSFHHSYAWVTANVATQKVAAEHITEKHRDTFLQTPRKDLPVLAVLEKKHLIFFFFFFFTVNINYCSFRKYTYIFPNIFKIECSTIEPHQHNES